MRLLFITVACLLSLSTLMAQKRERRVGGELPRVEKEDVLRVETSLVILPVSVKHRDGRSVGDLRKDEFKVFEEGVEQQISYFATVDEPFTVVLMLDTSSSVWKKLDKIKQAAIAFVEQLRTADKIVVASFAHRLTIHCEATSDREQLRKAIRGIGKGMSTHLYDTVEKMMKKKLSELSGRKAMIIFTDGVDESGDKNAAETLHYAEELDALIYTIRFDTYSERFDVLTRAHRGVAGLPGIFGPLSLPPGNVSKDKSLRDMYERGRRYLQALAAVTGGRYFEASSNLHDLDAAFAEIAGELRTQYSLGYYPHPHGQPGQRRHVRLRVERPETAVKSRESYVVRN